MNSIKELKVTSNNLFTHVTMIHLQRKITFITLFISLYNPFIWYNYHIYHIITDLFLPIIFKPKINPKQQHYSPTMKIIYSPNSDVLPLHSPKAPYILTSTLIQF